MPKYNGKTDKSTIPARVRDLGFACYADYLNSEHWLLVRREYMASDLPQKCKCGANRHAFHHLTYERLGSERLTDLIPVCKRCHLELEGKGRGKKTPNPKVGYAQARARRQREHLARRKKKGSNRRVIKEEGLGLGSWSL